MQIVQLKWTITVIHLFWFYDVSDIANVHLKVYTSNFWIMGFNGFQWTGYQL